MYIILKSCLYCKTITWRINSCSNNKGLFSFYCNIVFLSFTYLNLYSSISFLFFNYSTFPLRCLYVFQSFLPWVLVFNNKIVIFFTCTVRHFFLLFSSSHIHCLLSPLSSFVLFILSYILFVLVFIKVPQGQQSFQQKTQPYLNQIGKQNLFYLIWSLRYTFPLHFTTKVLPKPL